MTYEGDLIRPLGLVTLQFGYAEYEIDSFLQRLSDAGRIRGTWHSKPIGQKLAQLTGALRVSNTEVQSALGVLLADVDVLLAQRNILIHGCLLAGGRITSGRSGVDEKRTSVAELNSLAEGIFAWKERLSVFRWRQAHADDVRIYQTDKYGHIQYSKPSYLINSKVRLLQVDPYGNKLYSKQQYLITNNKIVPVDAYGNRQYNKPSLVIERGKKN